MYPKPDFSVFYSHFQVTSGEMTSFLCHFRLRGHMLSFPVMSMSPHASYIPV